MDYELWDVGYRLFIWVVQSRDLVGHGVVWYGLIWFLRTGVLIFSDYAYCSTICTYTTVQYIQLYGNRQF